MSRHKMITLRKMFFLFLAMWMFCIGTSSQSLAIDTDTFILVANGPFETEVVASLLENPHFTIVVLDGAANHFYEQGFTPHYILGDFDSIQKSSYRHFQKANIEFVHTPDQNHTDLEKGIQFCAKQGAKKIIIVCALGGERTDHSFANLSLLKKHHGKPYRVCIHTPKEIIEFLKDEERTIQGRLDDKFGLFGFPQARGWSKGLVWELNNYPLKLGGKNSACNVLRDEIVFLKVQGEALMMRPRVTFY